MEYTLNQLQIFNIKFEIDNRFTLLENEKNYF